MFGCLIRQFGRSSADGGDDNAVNTHVNNLLIAFKPGTKPTLRIKYVRLNSWRKWPKGLGYAMYRTEVIAADEFVSGRQGAFTLPDGMCETNGLVGLPPIGRDIAVKTANYTTGLNTANAVRGPTFTHFDDVASYQVNFRSIQLPSIPEYLIICAQRDVRMFSRTHSAGAAAPADVYPFAGDGATNGFLAVAGTSCNE